MRTHVDLCSGIGGFSLGFIAAKLSEPVLLCDFDEKVRKLLRVRFPGIPIANDVKEIASDPKRFIRQRPFILTSGYPCQPFSASGKRAGEEDPRHIFPHIAEIVAQTRPTYCVFENVYGHISLGLDKVLSQMGSLDYATATFIVPAAGFRPHKRDRLWIICKNMANTNNEGIWSCERGSDVDNEGSSGERGANRGGSSSHDEWNDTQTTKDERMVVAKDVSDTNSNGSSATKERESSEETIHEKQTRQIGTLDIKGASDLSQATRDVVNSKDIRPTFSPHEEQRKGSSTRYSEGELERGSADVANTERGSEETQLQWEQRILREKNKGWETDRSGSQDIPDRGIGETFASFRGIFDGISDWLDEPRHIQRTTHKNEYRADRLKQLGNALLPQITYRIGLAIKEIEEKK